MSTGLKCAECGKSFRWIDDVIKIEGVYFCTDCRVPITDIVAYHDPSEESGPSNWWDVDDVETGNPADFGFYEEEAEE